MAQTGSGMQRFRRGGPGCQGGPDSDKSLGAGPSRGCHRCPTPGCQTSHPSSSKASATVLNEGELEWRMGSKMIHFGAHVAAGTSVESTRSEGTQCPNRPSVWPASLVESARDTKSRESRDNSSRRLPDDPLGQSSSVVKVEQRR